MQNLSNTTTPWVCAKMAYTQGVDIMQIVSKHAEGMSLRYAVPEACRYIMMLFVHATCFHLRHSWTVGMWGLGLDPEGLDFAADSDDIASGDCAHDEHCHHD